MLKEKLLDEIEYIYNIGDFERLIGKCDELLKIDEDNPAALNYRAIALYYLGRYDESLKLLDYNLKLHPTNPYVLNNRALVFIALEDYQKALECCEEGLKYMDFDWLQKNKIEALIHLGRRDEAYEFYKSVDIPFYTFEEALENCGIIQKDGIFERMEVLLGERNFEDSRLCHCTALTGMMRNWNASTGQLRNIPITTSSTSSGPGFPETLMGRLKAMKGHLNCFKALAIIDLR